VTHGIRTHCLHSVFCTLRCSHAFCHTGLTRRPGHHRPGRVSSSPAKAVTSLVSHRRAPRSTRPTNIKRTWARRPSSKNQQTSSNSRSTRQRNGSAWLAWPLLCCRSPQWAQRSRLERVFIFIKMLVTERRSNLWVQTIEVNECLRSWIMQGRNPQFEMTWLDLVPIIIDNGVGWLDFEGKSSQVKYTIPCPPTAKDPLESGQRCLLAVLAVWQIFCWIRGLEAPQW